MHQNPPYRTQTRRQIGFWVLSVLSFGLITGCKPKTISLTSCQDLSQLSENEKQIRASLAYVDETPIPARRCDTCQFWLAPTADDQCGGCTILKGPIEAKGYCSSWAPPPANQGT